MNKIFEDLTLEGALNYSYIGNKKSHQRFQLFYCFLKNNIENPDLIENLKTLMLNQKINDLNNLTHTDNELNLVMFSNHKVALFLLENKFIDINAKDKLGNTFLVYASYDLIKKIDNEKFEFDWNHVNDNGDNIFSFAGKTGNIIVKKLAKASEKGVNPNHVNNEGLTAIDNVLLSRLDKKVKFMKLKDLVKSGCSFYGIKNERMISEEVKQSLVKYVSANEKKKLSNMLNNIKVESTTKLKKRI